MAKGQMRSNKEKKKPKADKNLKKGGAAAVNPFAAGKTPAGQSPTARRTDAGSPHRCRPVDTGLERSRGEQSWRHRRLPRGRRHSRCAVRSARSAAPGGFRASRSPGVSRLRRRPGTVPDGRVRLRQGNRHPPLIANHSRTVNVKPIESGWPIDPRAVPLTMESQGRVGPNTGGEET